MTDIIERAEAQLDAWRYYNPPLVYPLLWELTEALKVARAQRDEFHAQLDQELKRYNASELSENVIAHVLADISQVCDEDQWPLRQRLEVIQKICDGSEYVCCENGGDDGSRTPD